MQGPTNNRGSEIRVWSIIVYTLVDVAVIDISMADMMTVLAHTNRHLLATGAGGIIAAHSGTASPSTHFLQLTIRLQLHW